MFWAVVCDAPSALRRQLARRLAELPAVGGVEQADDVAALADVLRRSDGPALVLLGASGCGEPVSAGVRLVHRAAPYANVVLLTMGADPDEVSAGCLAGAAGYLARDATALELAALVALLPEPPAEPGATEVLTSRELQVLRGMSHGRSNAEIGQALFVSEDTVKTHAQHMFRKMQVHDRAHAVAEGLRRGLIA